MKIAFNTSHCYDIIVLFVFYPRISRGQIIYEASYVPILSTLPLRTPTINFTEYLEYVFNVTSIEFMALKRFIMGKFVDKRQIFVYKSLFKTYCKIPNYFPVIRKML